MENCLKITKILKNKTKIEIKYDINGLWKNLLNMKETFFVEYDVNIENVPDSICIIPFICNIAPIVWVFNLKIEINELDKKFYDCLEEVKKGYANMYPAIEMKGNILVNKLIQNEYKPEKNAVFFSGGVDAFNTLINHIDDIPDLLTVWGSDIALDDIKGWEKVKKYNELVANEWNLKFYHIKTNFRTFINYKSLSDYVSKRINGEWWHEFQHGIGLIGLAFPCAFVKKYGILYIASSYAANMKGKYTCASDPTIDNYLKCSNCDVVHDGYEYTRQDKIHNICNFSRSNNKPIQLRVCWESSGGGNCNECEKCWRTISGIIAEKENPSNYGFNLTDERRSKLRKKLYKFTKYNHWWYKDIQEKFLKNYTLEETPKDLLWLRDIKIKEKKPKYLMIYEKVKVKVKNIIIKIKRKIYKLYTKIWKK